MELVSSLGKNSDGNSVCTCGFINNNRKDLSTTDTFHDFTHEVKYKLEVSLSTT